MKNAFFNGLDEKNFTKWRESIVNRKQSVHACKHNLTLYELMQVVTDFYAMLIRAFRSCRDTPRPTDFTEFFWKIGVCNIFVVAYIDDPLIICMKNDTAKIIKNKSWESFALEDLGCSLVVVVEAIKYVCTQNTMIVRDTGAIGSCLKTFATTRIQ